MRVHQLYSVNRDAVYTSQARPCPRCKSTKAEYITKAALIEVRCLVCSERDTIVLNDHVERVTTADEIAAAHRDAL